MRILLITQLFVPEIGALPNRMYPIARKLAGAGHQVFVATGMPNYPTGVVLPEYRGKWIERECMDGFTVLRTAYLPVARNHSKWSQLASYLTFVLAALISGLRAGKVDVVMVTSPPIFPVVAAVLIATLRSAKLVFDVRDIWPDEIIACGAADEGSMPIRLVRAIERYIYRKADAVCCTTNAFLDTVISRGVPSNKAVLLPNGADLEIFHPVPSDNPIVSEFDLGNRFVVVYSGVLGIKHNIEAILDAAHLLRHQRDICFLLIGNGARNNALLEQCRSMELDNVIFAGERPAKEIPYLLSRAGVCLSSLLPEPYLTKIISVKIFEYLACERPVIAAQSGEGARVVEESGAGVAVPPGDARAIADAILQLYRDDGLRAEMGRRGRTYVEQNYSRSVIAMRLETLLRELCGERPTADVGVFKAKNAA